jgi:chloramphenicol O-acetyltransferase type A
MQIIDTANWARKAQYEFFKDFEDPFFGVTVEVECTALYKLAREKKQSFFIHYMHKALMAMNEIDEFKLRIDGDNVIKVDCIHGTTTVFKEDHTFAFSWFDYIEDFEEFYRQTQKILDAARKDKSLEPSATLDVVHVSVTPWMSFTQIKHPRTKSQTDSIPKILFGKAQLKDGKLMMPVNVEANHALMDGYHLSLFFKRFEELMMQ